MHYSRNEYEEVCPHRQGARILTSKYENASPVSTNIMCPRKSWRSFATRETLNSALPIHLAEHPCQSHPQKDTACQHGGETAEGACRQAITTSCETATGGYRHQVILAS